MGGNFGPADISPGMAAVWRDKMMNTVGRRKKTPSAHYVAGLLGGLSALWQKWLMDDLKIVSATRGRMLQPPKADQLAVKFATDEMIEHFYGMAGRALGDWPFPKLFLSTKAYTGCRLMDFCSLKSSNCAAGQLVFPADLTKGRKERAVPVARRPVSQFGCVQGQDLDMGGLPARSQGWPSRRKGGLPTSSKLKFLPNGSTISGIALYRLSQEFTKTARIDIAYVPQAGLHDGMAGRRRSSAGVYCLRLQRGHTDAALCRPGRTAGD